MSLLSAPSSEQETLTLVISAVHTLTPRINLYRLRDINNKDLPFITAGAHISISLTLTDGTSCKRTYSICSNPAERDHYDIAVLLDEQGRGGSRHIHEHFRVGTQLICETPKNHFQLHANAAPAILIAGGIGITPIKSMVHTLSLRGRRFTLHYAGRNLQEMAFIDELKTLCTSQLHLYPSDQHLRMDAFHLLADAPSNALLYVCGPENLLTDIKHAASALGIHQDRIQTEDFIPEKKSTNKMIVLELVRSHKIIAVDADKTLLNAVHDAGIPVNFDCCIGDCGSCAVTVISGTPEHRDHVLSDADKANGLMCLCVSRAQSDALQLDL